MVMFLFVIAYLGRHADAPWAGGPSWQALGAVAAAGALMVEIVVVVGLKASGRLSEAPDIDAAFGSPAEIGRVFLSDHLLAFEVTSIVLLVAAIGGVILGAHARREEPGAGT
jgi:NADH:ubiquinone oxidoreductase subunit 6 (subunit J)